MKLLLFSAIMSASLIVDASPRGGGDDDKPICQVVHLGMEQDCAGLFDCENPTDTRRIALLKDGVEIKSYTLDELELAKQEATEMEAQGECLLVD